MDHLIAQQPRTFIMLYKAHYFWLVVYVESYFKSKACPHVPVKMLNKPLHSAWELQFEPVSFCGGHNAACNMM